MRNRDYFIPSITALVLFGFIWFLSCAHQNRWKEDGDGSMDEFAENQSPSEPEQNQEQSSSNNDEFAANESAKASEDLGSSEIQPDDQSLEDKPDLETQEKVEGELAQQTPPSPEPEATSPAPEATAPATEGNAGQIFPPAVTPESQSQVIEEPVISEEVVNPKPNVSWVGKTPKIPRNAITRAGTRLNRFYFARKGDTPKKVSLLLYGDIQHTKKLTRWNGKPWAPGRLIYYVSPMEPKDSKMGSFYQERRITPEEYQVKSGDWLTRIAQKKLGSSLSWKEIAVVNGLKSPNSLEVGHLLAVYPKNLSVSPGEKPQPREQLTQNRNQETQEEPIAREESRPSFEAQMPPTIEPPAPQPSQEINPEPPPTPSPGFAPPQPGVGQAPTAEAPDEANTSGTEVAPSVNWDQIIEQNMVAILISAALIILLLALAARKKKARFKAAQRASSEDSAEESPSKFGRR